MGMDAVRNDVNVDKIGDIDWEEDNNDSEEEFEANYKVDNENDDEDLADNLEVQNEGNAIVITLPSCLTDGGSHVVGKGDVAVEDGEFSIGMEFGCRDSVISAIKSYTISRGIDYTVYESELQTFYTKCKGYGTGLIRKKGCWEIRRYNNKYTCTMDTISQDHTKLDSDTITDAISPLFEAEPPLPYTSTI
ncbi:hypothetical protein Ahy_A02g007462 isoform A [Arachis hypogaea]|uniref:Transposase MuDR plant domain-containing protein n=1 Tax=Arachis hypogaea TaxID=3818 RepID=A0A445ECA0_ARAHY|nr:hypothetical protein Ahy_A02g007462 isoform A [Arachis hypogaea]